MGGYLPALSLLFRIFFGEVTEVKPIAKHCFSLVLTPSLGGVEKTSWVPIGEYGTGIQPPLIEHRVCTAGLSTARTLTGNPTCNAAGILSLQAPLTGKCALNSLKISIENCLNVIKVRESQVRRA